ncbi:hypothetical protein ABU614_06275 [Lysobacter firmicutimachus]|uniref:Lipoprotein n=1 Tax=Lysobacter firmicutimachus TaxID=1792846 RepID=A0AAU8MUW8_9GAMM|nr:hypothetical protein [Lysobacter antibioticus]
MSTRFQRTALGFIRSAMPAGRGFAAALPVLAAACAHAPPPATGRGVIDVLQVEAAVFDDPAGRDAALRPACRAWRLSEGQIAAFFAASRELREGGRHDFYWLPCTIGGRLRADGREWSFSINAAATATWRDGDTVREWGCDAAACEPLVLLMPDGHEP